MTRLASGEAPRQRRAIVKGCRRSFMPALLSRIFYDLTFQKEDPVRRTGSSFCLRAAGEQSSRHRAGAAQRRPLPKRKRRDSRNAAEACQCPKPVTSTTKKPACILDFSAFHAALLLGVSLDRPRKWPNRGFSQPLKSGNYGVSPKRT